MSFYGRHSTSSTARITRFPTVLQRVAWRHRVAPGNRLPWRGGRCWGRPSAWRRRRRQSDVVLLLQQLHLLWVGGCTHDKLWLWSGLLSGHTGITCSWMTNYDHLLMSMLLANIYTHHMSLERITVHVRLHQDAANSIRQRCLAVLSAVVGNSKWTFTDISSFQTSHHSVHTCSDARTNVKCWRGHAFGAFDNKAPQYFLSYLITFYGSSNTIIRLVIAFVMVSTVLSVTCWLLFYLRCPRAVWNWCWCKNDSNINIQ